MEKPISKKKGATKGSRIIIIVVFCLFILILGVLGITYSYYIEKTSYVSKMQKQVDSITVRQKFDFLELEGYKEELTKLKDSIGRLNIVINNLTENRGGPISLTDQKWQQSKKYSLYNDDSFLKGQPRVSETTRKEKNRNKKNNKEVEKVLRMRNLWPCFTLRGSLINKDSVQKRTIFFKILDKKGAVIPDVTGFVYYKQNRYSKKIVISYTGEEKEVCEAITVYKKRLKIGEEYKMNIYDGERIISSTVHYID